MSTGVDNTVPTHAPMGVGVGTVLLLEVQEHGDDDEGEQYRCRGGLLSHWSVGACLGCVFVVRLVVHGVG